MVFSKQEIISMLSKTNPDLIISDIDISNRKAHFHCSNCGRDWDTDYHMYIRGVRGRPIYHCITCRAKRNSPLRKNISNLLDDLTKMPKCTLKYISGFKDYSTPCVFMCSNCSKTTKSRPTMILNRYKQKPTTGCKYCSRQEESLRVNKEWQKRTKELIPKLNEDIQVVKISNNKNKIRFKCIQCGYMFEKALSDFKRNPICPNCNQTGSFGERCINILLQTNHIDYLREYYKNINGEQCRFDFYVPKYNLIIEYDGEQHYNKHNPFYSENVHNHDLLKNKWAKEQGIKLIRIPYMGDIYSILKDYLPLKMSLSDSQVNQSIFINKEEILTYLETHSKKDTRLKFKVPRRKIDVILHESGYNDVYDLIHKRELERAGIKSNDDIVDWLRYNHLNKIKDTLGITPKYVINHIFNNPKYPFNNRTDLVQWSIKQPEFQEYRKVHTKRETERHFTTDSSAITKVLGTNDW